MFVMQGVKEVTPGEIHDATKFARYLTVQMGSQGCLS
jgi:hypothetical protein